MIARRLLLRVKNELDPTDYRVILLILGCLDSDTHKLLIGHQSDVFFKHFILFFVSANSGGLTEFAFIIEDLAFVIEKLESHNISFIIGNRYLFDLIAVIYLYGSSLLVPLQLSNWLSYWTIVPFKFQAFQDVEFSVLELNVVNFCELELVYFW